MALYESVPVLKDFREADSIGSFASVVSWQIFNFASLMWLSVVLFDTTPVSLLGETVSMVLLSFVGLLALFKIIYDYGLLHGLRGLLERILD
jgi:hypothetical protein